MEVKPGYKQTEVGVIPEDWDVVSLGESINYVKGYAFSSRDYRPNGVRILRVSDTTYETIKDKDPIFIDLNEAKSYSKWTLKEHDLVVSTVGSKPPVYDSLVGRVVIIQKKNEGNLLNQNALLMRSKDNDINTHKLLLNHLRTKQYLLHIEAIFRGNANQASITLIDLFNFKFPFPKQKKERDAIATALSDVDALISGLDRLIDKKRAIKQATMQELLTGKRRLPGFDSGEGYKQTEVGEIPEDWDVVTLNGVCDLINGRAYNINEWETTGTPVIRLQNLTGGTDYYYSNLQLPSKQYCGYDDLLFMWSATFGPHIWKGNRAIYHYHIWKVEPYLNKCGKSFLFYKLSEITQLLKNQSTNGGTMLHITKEIMENTTIGIPSLPEQTAIATVLSDMDAEISALETRRAKTISLKQGMMQELLTGRVRLV